MKLSKNYKIYIIVKNIWMNKKHSTLLISFHYYLNLLNGYKLLALSLLLSLSSVNGQNSKNMDKENSEDLLYLKEKLEEIHLQDQTLRMLLPEVKEKFDRDSKEYQYYWSLINSQDSINETAVIEIIEEYGWLGKNTVGEKANQTLWLVIQHSKIDVQKKYIKLLKNSVEKKESEGWHLAFLKDRILMREGKKQTYGTQAKYDEEKKEFYIYPISDPDNVNKRREKIGLEPIEDYAKKNGYNLNR
jgi:hypothetical protein